METIELEGKSSKRNYRVSNEGKTSETTRGTSCITVLVFFSHFILIKLERILDRLGNTIIRNNSAVFLISILILGICCLGLLRMRNEEMPPRRFEASQNLARKDLEVASKAFETLDSWKFNIFLTPNFAGNVLRPQCLDDAALVRAAVLTMISFQRICVRNDRKKCQTTSPVKLKGITVEDLEILTARPWNLSFHQNVVQLDETLKAINVTLRYNNSEKRFFVSAKSLGITLFVKKPRNKEERLNIYSFEDELALRLKNLTSHIKCVMIQTKSKNDENTVWVILTPKTSSLLYAIPVLLMSGLLLTFSRDNYVLSLLIFLVVILSNSLSVVAAFGICSLFGVTYQEIYLVVPFFLLCKGFMDSFLLVSALNNAAHLRSLRRSVRRCMTKTGLLITVTTCVDIILLGISIWSSFPGISSFFALALLSVFLMYVTTFVLLMPVLIWFCSRNHGSSWNKKPTERRTCSDRKGILFAKWVKLVTSVPMKFVFIFIILGMLALCAYVMVTHQAKFGTVAALYKDPNMKFKEIEALNTESKDVSILLKEGIDYANHKTRKDLIHLSNRLSQALYSGGRVKAWIASFEMWRNKKIRPCKENHFRKCLEDFLTMTILSTYKNDIEMRNVVTNVSFIKASRFHLPIKLASTGDKATMEQLQNDLKFTFGGMFRAVSDAFPAQEDLNILLVQTLKTVILAKMCVLVGLFFMTVSLRTAFVLVLNLSLQILQILTILFFFKVSFNQITYICTFPALMLSFNLSVYVAQACTVSNKDSNEDRIIDAVTTTAGPLLPCIVLLMLSSVALGFGFTHLSVLFHQVIPSFLVLGTFQAFAVIPVLLSTYEKRRKRFGRFALPATNLEKRHFKNSISTTNPYVIKDTIKPPVGVSIIGIGCRFPKAPSKTAFWQMLQQGHSAITAYPDNRPEEHQKFHEFYHPKRFVRGRMCTVAGSYLENIKRFDAGFFNISQQEANTMDPQQRILLQVVYEAIEDSGMTVQDLQACRTGVFVGVMNLDYGAVMSTETNKKTIDQFTSTGITGSMVSNRISFCFNFTGPSLTVDTACSSSLTAFKLAVDSLRNGDCDAALVCAPNIILSHMSQMTTSIAGLLAPDGRCKSFDASGDGYGRGEGFAAVVLKLTDASKDEDAYCGVVACGINNDGANAVPITAPSSRSQAELFRMVLQKSGLKYTDIDYIEAHGTGTAIGDVIETTSIGEAYCESKTDNSRVLKIGSVKSNVNHTESTSGLAGLIKVALMIKHGRLVPTVTVRTLNPKLKLSEKGMEVQVLSESWERRNGKPRIGGVNSYGYGGSNAHVILREIVPEKGSNVSIGPQNATYVLTLSARSKESLYAMARAFAIWLNENEDLKGRMNDICYSLNERRTVHPHRLAMACASLEEAIESLSSFGADSQGWEKKVHYGKVNEDSKKLVFMFGGQGTQWFAMGRQLIENEPTFRTTVLEVNNLLKEMGEEWSLLSELMASEEMSRMNELVIGQTATFTIQYAIARLLISWGIYPSAVVGHSLGEFAAACTAGALSVKEALGVVVLRAKLQVKCPENGAMAALGMPVEETKNLLIDLKLEETVNIAAINDAKSVTLSGDKLSIECFGNYLFLNNSQVFWRILNTSRAFHSFHMTPIEKAFQVAAVRIELKPKNAAISFYSTVEGDAIPGKELNHTYWWKNIRYPVQFSSAVKTILKDGFRNIVEIGAQPSLAHYVKQIAVQEKLDEEIMPAVIATLPRKGVKEQHKVFMLNTVCALHTKGYRIKWDSTRYFGPCRFIRPQTYSWQEEEYWYKASTTEKKVLPFQYKTDVETSRRSHPFIGNFAKTEHFSGLCCWTVEIDLHRLPYLRDHALTQGGVIMPGAIYLEMAFAMAKDRFLCSSVELRDVKVSSLLTLPEGQVRPLKLRLMTSIAVGDAEFQITSVQEDESELLLSRGKMRCDTTQQGDVQWEKATRELDVISDEVKDIIERMQEFPLDDFRTLTSGFGFSYGPSFSIIKRVWKGENEGLCLVTLDDALFQEVHKYVVHPSILDACLQSCLVAIWNEVSEDSSIVSAGWNKVSVVFSHIPRFLICHATKIEERPGSFDVTLMSMDGNPILKMTDFQSAELNTYDQSANPSFEDISYEVEWAEGSPQIEPVHDAYSDVVCVVLKDSKGLAARFIDGIKEKGAEALTVDVPKSGDFLIGDERQVQEVLDQGIRISTSKNKKLNVVSFWPVEADSLPGHLESIDRAQNISFRSSIFLLKRMFDVASFHDSLLLLISQETQFVERESSSSERSMPWSSLIWGLKRTASLETVNIKVKAVDVSLQPTKEEIQLLLNELVVDDEEEEVVLRAGTRYVSRFVRLKESTTATEDYICHSKQNDTENFYLDKGRKDERIALRGETPSTLLDSELEVQLTHVFSIEGQIVDFAKGKPGCVAFSGQVHGIGSSSPNFKIGDNVCGIVAPSRIGKYIRVSQSQLMLKPTELNLLQSATLPFCVILAFQALQRATAGQNSSLVLIHEVNKGVGFAAAAIAKGLGHSVLCTSTQPRDRETKDHLLRIGVEDVVDSSCLCLDEKYNEKFDTVLFLSPPRPGALQSSYSALKLDGKLVIACNEFSGQVTLPGYKRISYERIEPVETLNSTATFEDQWKGCHTLLTTTGMLERLCNVKQHTRSIYVAIEDWNRNRDCNLRETKVSSASSIVFNSFTFDNSGKPGILLPGIDHFGMKGNRTYMVAGGVRGFGFQIARWMAENGAKTIILLARSPPSEAKKLEVTELQEQTGAAILIMQVDVSREDHMISFEKRLKELPSMAGIVHTAMVLRDNVITAMDIDSFREVMAPKVKGAFLLHKLSLRMNLDFFVMFSSMASVIGNVGQASYAAANAFLDGLMAYRRRVLGLPGLSINWGPIGGAGVLAREENIADILTKSGLGLIKATEGPKFMAEIMASQPSRYQISLCSVDWPVFLSKNLSLSKSKRLESLRNESSAGDQKTALAKSLASRILLEKDSSKRAIMAEEYVYTTLAWWAGIESLAEVDKNTSIFSYGIDSTAALTLKMQLESALQVSFEVFYFMQPDTTPAKMAKDVIKKLANSTSSSKVEETESSKHATRIESAQVTNGDVRTHTSSTTQIAQPVRRSCQIVPLHDPDKAEVKFFCVHPSHRYAMSLAQIATGFQFQDLISFYAIGFTEPTERGKDWESVRQLAMEYTELIRSEQRHGPYFLGGYSFGGLVAYEIASIMTELEEQVEFVSMIDTFPWLQPSRGYSKLASWFKSDFSAEKFVEFQYEAYLAKLAVQILKMREDDYEALRSQHSTVHMMELLQQKSQEMDVPLYDLKALRESLLHDQLVASRTHNEWEPAEVQYEGPVLYLKSESPRFSTSHPSFGSQDKAWSEVLVGTVDVCVCPGDHFSLSELPHARITGGILATCVGIKYRTLFPELYRFGTDYKQSRAIRKFQEGVQVILYSKKDVKPGKLFFDYEKQELRFSRKDQCSKENFQGKTIILKGVRSVLPGRYVCSAIKRVQKRNRTSVEQPGNLSNVVSVIGQRRTFYFEIPEFDDLKEFYCMIEGVYNVKIMNAF